jgi:DNA-binding NarL/FixJ family response regulator
VEVVTGLLVISIIALGSTLVILTQHRRFLESYRQEVLQTLQESQAVKSDLEQLLIQAVELSDQITAKLESQVMDQLKNTGDKGDNSPTHSQEASNFSDRDSDGENGHYELLSEADQDLPSYYHQVLALHQQGYAIKDIARKLNMGRGEVSLILNIIQKRRVV